MKNIGLEVTPSGLAEPTAGRTDLQTTNMTLTSTKENMNLILEKNSCDIHKITLFAVEIHTLGT